MPSKFCALRLVDNVLPNVTRRVAKGYKGKGCKKVIVKQSISKVVGSKVVSPKEEVVPIPSTNLLYPLASVLLVKQLLYTLLG